MPFIEYCLSMSSTCSFSFFATARGLGILSCSLLFEFPVSHVPSVLPDNATFLRCHSLQMFPNSILNGAFIRPNNLIHLLPTLEKHESRHGPHTQLLRHVGNLIDVDLVEVDFILEFVGVTVLEDFRGDDFARAAPGCETIEDDEFAGGAVDDGGLEGGFTVDGVNTSAARFGGCRRGGGVLGAEFGLVVGYVLC
jgi:hypothetical protein